MAIKKYSVKASAEAKAVVASKGEYISAAQFADTLKSAKKKFNEKFKKGPYACAEVQGMGYIYYNDGSKIYVPNVLRSYDDALAQVKKLNADGAGKVAASKSFKKTVKASSSLKVKPYVINKGQSGEYYGLKNAEDNQVLHSAPNNWKSEKGAINWAKKKGYEVVNSACGKKSVKAGRYSDAVPYENRKYWYFTTHGIGPGMLPKGVNVLDTQEGQNRKGTWGDYILLDAVLNTDELREYDLVELAPLDKEPTIKPYKNKNTISVFDSCGKKSVKASELLSGIDKLPERGKVITKTINGDPTVIVGIGDNKYMYRSYLNKASASGDVQFIRNLIKKGEVPANAVKNLGYKLYTASDNVESACGKKSVKSSKSVKSFGVKASKSAKKRKAIKASGIQNDIVMYFNGDNVYQGSVYDLADAVENLCYDDEVNAKFQEWCNQFGDPFDFDGSPIDTARVFTDIIIHEAEEAPETENGGSQFYEDGNGILDFEILYANEGIYSAKSIKAGINAPDTDGPLCVCEHCLQGIESHEGRQVIYNEISEFDIEPEDKLICDWCEEESDKLYQISPDEVNSAKSIKCWDNGNDVWEYQESYDNYYDEEPPEHIAKELERLAKLTDKYTDRWFEKFEELHPGERFSIVYSFPDVDEAVGYTLDDAEYRPDEIKASTDIKADTWESSEENINDMLNDSYEYDGFDDSDMLEYVDSFLQDASSGAWLSTDHVVYNGPDDWEVSAGLSPEAVESDFWFFLDDVDHELYEDMLEADLANPLDEDPVNYTYNQNAINGEEFYIQLYPNNNQMSAPQIDFDEKYLTPEWLDRLEEIRKQYEESRKAAYTEFQSSLGSFLANGITASTEVNAELQLGRDKWNRKKYNWSDNKNSITDIDGYVKDLADGVVERFPNLTYDISDEAITFTDETGAVVYIQPIDEIVPEKDDLDNDITELGDAIQHANEEADWFSQEQVWDDWDDDPDYATRAVELSRDINCAEETVDIDDLEYITGDTSAEDRIFDVIIDKLRASELSEFGEVDILSGDADIKVYPDGADIDYIIAFIADPITINFEDRFMKYEKYPDYNMLNHTQHINGLTTEIIVHNGTISAVNYVDLDDYGLSNYDIPAYEKYVEQLARPVVEEIYNFVDQAVYDGNITSSTAVTADVDDEPEDMGYGFDSNGDPIDESTVEELERIAQEILDKSEIHNVDEYADLHNFNYYASIPYIQESFDISFTYVADIYELSKNGMATDEGIYTTVAPYNIRFNVRCKNGEVEYAECTDIDVNDGYVKDVELKNFNLDALVQFATDLVNPVAMDIYNGTTNI